MARSGGGFYGTLIVIIAVIAALLWWLQLKSEEPATVTAQASPGPAAHASAPPPQQYAAPMAPAPMQYQPTPMPTPVPGGCDLIPPIAQRARVSVASCVEQGGWVVVTVQAYERNALNDFMDEALRSGMRDLDVNQRQFRQSMDRQQRMVFQDTFKMRF
jgi:hypothetical protein